MRYLWIIAGVLIILITASHNLITPAFPSQFDPSTLLLLSAYKWIIYHPFEIAGIFVATYILQRICEKYNPFKNLWNSKGTRFWVEYWDCQYSSSIPEYRTLHPTRSYRKACRYAYKLAKNGKEDRFVYVVDERGRRLKTYQGMR